VTTETIVIDNDVILDGEGKLTVDGNASEAGEGHTVFIVAFSDIAVELRGIGVTGGGCPPPGPMTACFVTGIQVDNIATASQATLTLTDCTVWNNEGVGVYQNVGGTLTLLNTTVSGSGFSNVQNRGVLTVINSTISNARATVPEFGAAIFNIGQMTMLNSTVSGNEGVGIFTEGVTGTSTLTNCTLSSNAGGDVQATEGATVALASTIVEGVCNRDVASDITSNGYNIESPGDTCGFDQTGDQPNVTEGQLNLGPLQDNGGPTMTHALGPGSVAVDHIPAVDCQVTEDQRGQPRPETGGDACDVGSFERQPTPTEGCIQSGGTVSTALCCQATESFPNTCAIGACGCAPDASHEVDVCICPANTCFDGESCVAQ
jgi:hypothetical protein